MEGGIRKQQPRSLPSAGGGPRYATPRTGVAPDSGVGTAAVYEPDPVRMEAVARAEGMRAEHVAATPSFEFIARETSMPPGANILDMAVASGVQVAAGLT